MRRLEQRGHDIRWRGDHQPHRVLSLRGATKGWCGLQAESTGRLQLVLGEALVIRVAQPSSSKCTVTRGYLTVGQSCGSRGLCDTKMESWTKWPLGLATLKFHDSHLALKGLFFFFPFKTSSSSHLLLASKKANVSSLNLTTRNDQIHYHSHSTVEYCHLCQVSSVRRYSTFTIYVFPTSTPCPAPNNLPSPPCRPPCNDLMSHL